VILTPQELAPCLGSSSAKQSKAKQSKAKLSFETLDERVVPDAGPIDPPESPPAQSPPSQSAEYATYVQTVTAAYQDFQSALTASRAIHQATFAAADASLSQSLLAAATTASIGYESIRVSTQTQLDTLVGTINTSYESAYATFSAAWDAANGNVPLLEAAVSQFNATIDALNTQMDQGLNSLLASAQMQADAVAVVLQNAVDTALETWETTTLPARLAEQTAKIRPGAYSVQPSKPLGLTFRIRSSRRSCRRWNCRPCRPLRRR
jgi:hypothetical protein